MKTSFELAARLPRILQDIDMDAARSAVMEHNHADFLPERLMAFNINPLYADYRVDMLSTLFPDIDVTMKDASELSALCADLGRIGFSFPLWRFPTQGFEGRSLLERFGYTRLQRETDLRDPSLPPGHPGRDEFGTGFAGDVYNQHIEYRRAYILISAQKDDPVSIVIRNSSYFFGRDRLPEPVYISWKPKTPEELNRLNQRDFEHGGDFMPLQAALAERKGDLSGAVKNIRSAIARFDNIDHDFAHWMTQYGGQRHLNNFILHVAARQEAAGKADQPAFYICEIDKKTAPWFPYQAKPATAEQASRRQVFDNAVFGKPALLSGPHGDFPAKPADPLRMTLR